MAKRKRGALRPRPEPSKWPKGTIWLACYVGGPDFVEGYDYAALELDLEKLLEIRRWMTVAKSLEDQLGTGFYRFEMFNGLVDPGDRLGDDGFEELTDQQQAVLDVQEAAQEEGSWVKLPEGWSWPEGSQDDSRTECMTIGVGPRDVLWTYRPKHVDGVTLETPTLDEATIERLIRELTGVPDAPATDRTEVPG